MKNLLFLIAIITLAFACTKPIDTEDLPKVDPTLITKAPSNPTILNHSYRTYYLKNIKTSKGLMDSTVVADTTPVIDTLPVVPVVKVPSINISDTVQYIKFVSYYSEDANQVNVHEIEAYSNGVNIALNKPSYASSINSCGGGEKENINDGDYISRWSSDRDTATKYMADSLQYIRINLLSRVKVDSIRLYLYQTGTGSDTTAWTPWKQTFKLYISRDFSRWDSIGGGIKVNQLTF